MKDLVGPAAAFGGFGESRSAIGTSSVQLVAEPRHCHRSGVRTTNSRNNVGVSPKLTPGQRAVDVVPAAARPAGGIARPVANRPRRSRTPCSPCFIWSRSGIPNFHNDNPAPAQGVDARRNI